MSNPDAPCVEYLPTTLGHFGGEFRYIFQHHGSLGCTDGTVPSHRATPRHPFSIWSCHEIELSTKMGRYLQSSSLLGGIFHQKPTTYGTPFKRLKGTIAAPCAPCLGFLRFLPGAGLDDPYEFLLHLRLLDVTCLESRTFLDVTCSLCYLVFDESKLKSRSFFNRHIYNHIHRNGFLKVLRFTLTRINPERNGHHNNDINNFGLRKGYPQIIHFYGIFYCKPTILDTPIYGNPQLG